MTKQGIGVELNLSSEKARSEVQALIEQLSNLEKTVDKFSNVEITLSSKDSSSNIAKLEKQISDLDSNVNAKFASTTKKITTAIGTATGKAISETSKVKTTVEESYAAMEKASDKTTAKAVTNFNTVSRAASTAGKAISGIGDFGGKLNQSITSLSNSLLSPIKSVFSSANSFVTATVNESIDQIEKLELAEVGLRNHFKSDTTFNIEDYLQRIRSTAERTQGLSAGDLADYIAQLAPLSKGNSDAAFDATMGALKIIKYGGGDTNVDMMSIIKNIRDVQSKGKAYQMDLNQFNRAAPLLAAMLDKQGLSQFVKEGTDGTLSLNITKDNYQGLLNAFAQLNYNDELNDAFDEMSKTLSGLIEQTKQSVQNDVMDLIKYHEEGEKSLLDLWKEFLQGTGTSSLRTTIRNALQEIIRKVVKFLDNLDGQDILETTFKYMKEFGHYLKTELLPVIKNALGLDENTNPTDVIKGLIRSIIVFAKGVVQGLKFFINAINMVKGTIERVFGEGSGSIIMMAFGWVKGFGKIGWDLVSGLGKLVATVSNASGKISQFMTKYLGTSGTQNLGWGLTGLGVASSVVDAVVDTRSAEDKIITNVLSAGATFAGLTMATGGNFVVGGVGALAQLAIKTLVDIHQDTEALRKKVVDEQEADLATTQAKIIDTVLEDFSKQDNPIYRYGDETGEKAAKQLREWAKTNIKNEGTEEDMLQEVAKASEEYKKIYTNLVGGNKLLELSQKYLQEEGGKTRLTNSNANQQKNAENLKKYWDYLVRYGFVQKFDNWDKVLTEGDEAGASIFAFLTGNKILDGDPTVEGLQNVINNLGQVDAAIQEIEERNPKVEIQVLMETGKTEEAARRIKKALQDAGLNLETIDGKKVWVAETTIRDAGKAGMLDSYEGGKQMVELGLGKSGGLGFNSNQRRTGIANESKQALQNAFEINSSDLLGQWAGARARLQNGDFNDGKNQEDFNNWVNSVNDTIGKAMSIIFNGGTLDLKQKSAVVTGLQDIYGTWNQVFKAFDPEQVMVLVHGLQNIIGEDTGVAVQMLRDGYDFGNIGITGSGVDRYKEASASHEGEAFYFADLWEDIKKKYLEVQALYKADGGYIGPTPRKPKPLFFNWGGSARGVDTVPAMLSPGEFVEKTSAVNKAGLSVMTALNEGDLGRAYRLLGAKLNTNTTNSYDSRRYNTTDSHNMTTNHVRIFNSSRSAANTSYRGLRNIMALR